MKKRYLGHGIGLRTPHHRDILEGPVDVDWFEVISENFIRPGGNPRRVLHAIRERFPVVMHGVSLSLGSVDPLNQDYLHQLAALEKEIQPELVSDHLCWSGYGGTYAHDLLPLPFTEEALQHIAERIQRVQDKLGRQFVVENVSSYMNFSHSTMSEWEFLSALCRRADCGLLLDVNNIFVSAHNHKFDARDFIRGVPADRVMQIHLAGHSTRGELLLDTHDHDVRTEVWDLYRFALQTLGPVSTLIERDDHIPPLADVVAESRRAAAITAEITGVTAPDPADTRHEAAS